MSSAHLALAKRIRRNEAKGEYLEKWSRIPLVDLAKGDLLAQDCRFQDGGHLLHEAGRPCRAYLLHFGVFWQRISPLRNAFVDQYPIYDLEYSDLDLKEVNFSPADLLAVPAVWSD